jgi:hypothetical protein
MINGLANERLEISWQIGSELAHEDGRRIDPTPRSASPAIAILATYDS